MSISTRLGFQRCAYELLGWSGARVMKVFIVVAISELLRLQAGRQAGKQGGKPELGFSEKPSVDLYCKFSGEIK